MTTFRYLHLDVFTDRPFEGNQLAVFPEPGSISAEIMQTIAREMNFSESTFVRTGAAIPSSCRAGCRTRTGRHSYDARLRSTQRQRARLLTAHRKSPDPLDAEEKTRDQPSEALPKRTGRRPGYRLVLSRRVSPRFVGLSLCRKTKRSGRSHPARHVKRSLTVAACTSPNRSCRLVS
jgi:hypothetical protein